MIIVTVIHHDIIILKMAHRSWGMDCWSDIGPLREGYKCNPSVEYMRLKHRILPCFFWNAKARKKTQICKDRRYSRGACKSAVQFHKEGESFHSIDSRRMRFHDLEKIGQNSVREQFSRLARMVAFPPSSPPTRSWALVTASESSRSSLCGSWASVTASETADCCTAQVSPLASAKKSSANAFTAHGFHIWFIELY